MINSLGHVVSDTYAYEMKTNVKTRKQEVRMTQINRPRKHDVGAYRLRSCQRLIQLREYVLVELSTCNTTDRQKQTTTAYAEIKARDVGLQTEYIAGLNVTVRQTAKQTQLTIVEYS